MLLKAIKGFVIDIITDSYGSCKGCSCFLLLACDF